MWDRRRQQTIKEKQYQKLKEFDFHPKISEKSNELYENVIKVKYA